MKTSSDETMTLLPDASGSSSVLRVDAPFDELGPGTIINDSYRVHQRLGAGAMGVVLLAHDLRLERDVAIKLIRPELVLDEHTRKRFLTEARAMARVRHPNVVEIFAYGDITGSPYFAMEYVNGPTLDRWVHQQGEPPLPPADAIGVLDQVCRGVSAIHETGALHRDIKTTNILVGPGFRVVVADFGLACRLETPESGEHGGASGTPEFMAPELFGLVDRDPSLAARADVYSLGVVAFELLTGRMPFDYTTLFALVQKLATQPPLRPSVVRPGLSPALDGPILRALAKHPAERTPSVEIFRQELTHAYLETLEPERPSLAPLARAARLLVADDDQETRAFVRRVLAKALPSLAIEEAQDGLEALRRAEASSPSMALIDLDMPGMNGVELTAALRERATPEQMPIMVMTGSGTAADWRVLSGLGANGILLKPVTPVQLVTLVRSMLLREKGELE